MMRKFLFEERGSTAIEYALIASLIGIVLVAAVSAIGGSLNGTFNDVASGLG